MDEYSCEMARRRPWCEVPFQMMDSPCGVTVLVRHLPASIRSVMWNYYVTPVDDCEYGQLYFVDRGDGSYVVAHVSPWVINFDDRKMFVKGKPFKHRVPLFLPLADVFSTATINGFTDARSFVVPLDEAPQGVELYDELRRNCFIEPLTFYHIVHGYPPENCRQEWSSRVLRGEYRNPSNDSEKETWTTITPYWLLLKRLRDYLYGNTDY